MRMSFDFPTYRTLAVAPLEEVDAGRVGEVVGEADLAEVRSPARAACLAQVAEREDAEPTAEIEEPVQDLRARLRIVQRTMDRGRARAEVLRERAQLHVGHVRPDHTARELGGAHRRSRQQRVVEPAQVLVQEGEVEPRVVRDEDRAARELAEGGEHLLDGRLAGHQLVADARELGDEGRDRRARIDQRLEHAEALAAPVGHRSDLGDAAILGGAARRLQVHDAEGHLRERDPFVERGLDGLGEHRAPFVRRGRTGRPTIPNRCSSVKR